MGELTLITFIPVIGAILILFVPKSNVLAMKIIAAVATFIPFVIASIMWLNFDYSLAGINNEQLFNLQNMPNGFPLLISNILWVWMA